MRSFFVFLILSMAINLMAQEQGHWQFGVKRNAGVGFYYHSTAHVTAGWRFDRNHYLGIGTGINWMERHCDDDPSRSNGTVNGVPLFLDYTHYTPLRKGSQHSLFYGLEAGGGVYTGDLPTIDDSERFFPYLVPKLGLDFTCNRYLGLNLGFCCIFSEAWALLGVQAGLRF